MNLRTIAPACLAGALLLGAFASPARANYVIAFQVGAGPITNCANSAIDTSANCGGASVGGLSVDGVNGTSNSPGGSPFPNANQFGSTFELTNNTGATVTVKVWFASQNFTFPVAPPPATYVSNLNITQTSGNSSTTLESCVDQSNGTAPGLPGGAFCSTPAAILNNPASVLSGAGSSPLNTVSTNIPALHGPYSLSQVVTVTLDTGTQLNIISSQVLTPTPEPASFALFGSAFLGVGLFLRKKVKGSRV
jgi:hypothetical protein